MSVNANFNIKLQFIDMFHVERVGLVGLWRFDTYRDGVFIKSSLKYIIFNNVNMQNIEAFKESMRQTWGDIQYKEDYN